MCFRILYVLYDTKFMVIKQSIYVTAETQEYLQQGKWVFV